MRHLINRLRRIDGWDLLSFAVAALATLILYSFRSSQGDGLVLADNTLLTISMITHEGMRLLKNALGFTSRIRRDLDSSFAVKGAKIGDTLNIRKPPRYVGRFGNNLQIEDTTETSVPLKLDQLFGVDVAFGSVERTLSLDAYSERVLKPKIATIANKVDSLGLKLYKKVANAVGTPGTVPSAFSTYLDAGVFLDDEAAPQDDMRYMALSPRMQGTIVASALGYFNPQSDITRQYRKGHIKEFGGFEFFMDQNVSSHTVGTYAGTPLVNGANQSGSSLITDGWSSGASALNEGDVFTVANVYAVNPQNRESTGQLRRFVVTEGVSDSSGAMTIPIWPAITVSGAFQTVDSLPADNAPITVHGATGTTHRVGLGFHRDFAVLGCADLEEVRGVHECARVSDEDTGLSMRSITFYDGNVNRLVTRTEILFGWAILYPELAVRISS